MALATQLEQFRAESEAAMSRVSQEAAAREEQVRIDAARSAEEAVQAKLNVAELARQSAERARAETEITLREELTAAKAGALGLKEEYVNEINLQREALEKDKIVSDCGGAGQKLERK